MNNGHSDRLMYDDCATAVETRQSLGPFGYRMSRDPWENNNKCIYNEFVAATDVRLVDAESELQNRTRRASKCPTRKYNPNCEKSKNCTSTFDESNPIVYAPEVCSIVRNNLPRPEELGKGFNSNGASLACCNKV